MVIGLIDAAIAYKNEKWAKEVEIVLQKMTTVFWRTQPFIELGIIMGRRKVV